MTMSAKMTDNKKVKHNLYHGTLKGDMNFSKIPFSFNVLLMVALDFYVSEGYKTCFMYIYKTDSSQVPVLWPLMYI